MDQLKTGKFIAALRKQAGLTQEALGEKLGVTNKTVSRWECGNYMPDVEMLQLLSKEFHVGINELLAGERLSDAALRMKAAENVIAASIPGAFSLEERKKWLKWKWRREHIPMFAILSAIALSAFLLPLLFHKPWLSGLAQLIAVLEYGYQNNKMMAYVEAHIYGN